MVVTAEENRRNKARRRKSQGGLQSPKESELVSLRSLGER